MHKLTCALYIYIYIYSKIWERLHFCQFYNWSIQVFVWVIWHQHEMNSKSHHIFFPCTFGFSGSHLQRNKYLKWQTQWQVVCFYFKCWRKNKCKGKLWKRRNLLKVRGRISRKKVKGISECRCHIQNCSGLNKDANLYLERFKNLEFLFVFSLCNMEVFSVRIFWFLKEGLKLLRNGKVIII